MRSRWLRQEEVVWQGYDSDFLVDTQSPAAMVLPIVLTIGVSSIDTFGLLFLSFFSVHCIARSFKVQTRRHDDL
jgi:hypothetical protein